MVVRFGVALPEELAREVDSLVEAFGYGSRSQFVSEAVRVYASMLSLLASRRSLVGVVVVVLRGSRGEALSQLLRVSHETVVSVAVTRAGREHAIACVHVRGHSSGIREVVESLRRLDATVNVIPILVPLEEDG